MGALLEAHDLELGYGDVRVCRSLSFTVNEGEIVTLIGANGAGKTTTMMAVAGALPVSGGRIRFRGEDITSMPSYERARRGITLVPEGRRVFPFMTVLENLEMGAFKHRRDGSRVRGMLGEVFEMFPPLAERRQHNGGTLSGGEQQMLAIGRAWMSRPQLLCLDEPSLGLGPLIVKDIFEIVRRINATGTTVLLVEQNAQYALRTASRGYVLQTGQIMFEGSTDELRADERVRQAYLGQGREGTEGEPA